MSTDMKWVWVLISFLFPLYSCEEVHCQEERDTLPEGFFVRQELPGQDFEEEHRIEVFGKKFIYHRDSIRGNDTLRYVITNEACDTIYSEGQGRKFLILMEKVGYLEKRWERPDEGRCFIVGVADRNTISMITLIPNYKALYKRAGK